MNSRNIILSFAAAYLLAFQAFAGNTFSYKGTTDSKILGTEEKRPNMILNATEISGGYTISLKDFALYGKEGVSLSGTIKTDANGNVTGIENMVVKGGPAKIKSITGLLTKDKADLYLNGKAVGTINFEIHYTAKINR